MPPTPTFDITTADDFYREIVIPQYNDFLANNSSRRHALLTTLVLYHFYEWIHHTKFTADHFKSVYSTQVSMTDVFETARQLTNGTKHFKNSNVKTSTQKGFSSGFSDAFARPLLIEWNPGIEKSVDVFLRELIDFWKDQKIAGAF